MAKGTLNGILQGKLGNTVFYKVTNSNNKEKQGSRLYVPTVSNPRTAPQASQRMRMKPAINFYRGLADLLDHSWEGVKYGALSRQKFMSLALSPTVQNIPFVDKGESRFIPGEYPLSLGSVGVNTQGLTFNNSGESATMTWDLLDSFVFNDGETWGVVSTNLIQASQGSLRDGDEITAIFVFEKNGFYVPVHSYVVLDTASQLDAQLIFGRNGFVIQQDGAISRTEAEDGGYYDVLPISETGALVAGGIIVSRHPSRTSTTWLRSTSTMVVTEEFRNIWMSAERYATAEQTYRDSTTELTSDWLLNQAGSASGNAGEGGSGGLIQDFTLEGRQVTPYGGGAPSTLAYYNDGTNEGFICNNWSIVELPDDQGAYYVANNVQTLSGRNLSDDGAFTFVSGTKLISFAQYPRIRQKIAQFYNFV